MLYCSIFAHPEPVKACGNERREPGSAASVDSSATSIQDLSLGMAQMILSAFNQRNTF